MVHDSLNDVFIDDLKKYLKENLNLLFEDYEFNKVNVDDAYSYQKNPNPPEIAVLGIDYNEDTDSNTYDDTSEVMSNVVIQFYCYGKEMRIKDSDTRYDPIKVTRILADFLTRTLKKNTLVSKNPNVISSRKTTQTNALNIRDNSLYYCVLRYEFVILNDYKKIYRD